MDRYCSKAWHFIVLGSTEEQWREWYEQQKILNIYGLMINWSHQIGDDMYKIKLQPGDYARRDMGEDKYRECAQRFLDDGCPKREEIGTFSVWTFFGWHKDRGFMHLDKTESFDGGRLLTYEQIMEKDMTDNSWYEKGELPPVGEKVIIDFYHKNIDFFHLKEALIVAHDHSWTDPLAVFGVRDGNSVKYHGLIKGSFRPIKSDREKAIDEMLKIATPEIISNRTITIMGALYDAGYRKTEGDV